MENSTRNSSKLHPMIWVAAIAVTALSIAGVAALTGVFPSANSEPEDPYAKKAEQAAAKPAPKTTPAPVAEKKPATCSTCGVITEINSVRVDGQGTGLGAVAGGVVGGLLGNQVGGGSGKKVATVAGVAGGAYAGHEIEKNQRATNHYDIFVRMDDGTTRRLRKSGLNGLSVGEKVRVEGNSITQR